MKHRAWITVTILLLVCAFGAGVRAQEPDRRAKVTKPAQIITDSITADTWDALYGPGVTPHPMAVYTEGDLDWLVKPESLAWMVEHRIGVVVFDEYLYTGRATPVDGKYTYKYPEKTQAAQDALRAVGIRIIGYIGVEWRRDAHKTPLDAIAEIRRHDWDGGYFDNLHLGNTVEETTAFAQLMHALGLVIFEHASMEPHFGRVAYRGPWAKYATYVRQGEQGEKMAHPKSVFDPLWRFWISQVLQPGSAIGIIKAGSYRQPSGGELEVLASSMWYDTERHSLKRIVYYLLPKWGCTVYVTRGNVMRDFETFYFPMWQRLQAEFLADPAAFRAARNAEFGVNGG